MTFMAPGKKWQDTTAPCIKELRTQGTKFTWILWAMWRSSLYFWYDLSERCFFVGFRHEVLEGQRNPSGETEHGLCCVREDVSTINSVQWCWSAKQRSRIGWGLHQGSWLLVLLRGETGDDLTLTSYLHLNVTILSSFQICTFLQGATVHMIEEQKVPYAVKQKEWVGYDNKASYDTKVVTWPSKPFSRLCCTLCVKGDENAPLKWWWCRWIQVRYLKENRFGGAFVWSLDLDDFKGEFCGQGDFVLINHLRSLLATGQNSYWNTLQKGWLPCWEYIAVVIPDLPPLPTQPTVNLSTTNTTPRPAPTPHDNFCATKNVGIYAKPEDSSSFYSCVNGLTWMLKCPAGLVFKESCLCCAFPWCSQQTWTPTTK